MSAIIRRTCRCDARQRMRNAVSCRPVARLLLSAVEYIYIAYHAQPGCLPAPGQPTPQHHPTNTERGFFNQLVEIDAQQRGGNRQTANRFCNLGQLSCFVFELFYELFFEAFFG
jgi:hypothetical protein